MGLARADTICVVPIPKYSTYDQGFELLVPALQSYCFRVSRILSDNCLTRQCVAMGTAVTADALKTRRQKYDIIGVNYFGTVTI
jgi:hypothetical protein